MRARLIPALCVGIFGLVACTSTSQATNGADRNSPPATIGLGSDAGQISGAADVRAIDAASVESIVMVGDSITVGSTSVLDRQFAQIGFEDVNIVAQNSKRMTKTSGDNISGAEIIKFIANNTERPAKEQLWVIALGTNDISQYNDVDDVVAEIDELLAPISEDSPVIWINTYFGGRPEETALVNAAIDQVIASRANATIARWSEIAPTDGVLSGDRVHPDNDGAVVFASLVTMTVANVLGRS